jgi:hypothetical protein
MNKLIIASILGMSVATNAMAINFDTEWAKFKQDFSRLKPSSKAVEVTPVEDAVPVGLTRVDPKSPDRLGHTITDPVVRNKVVELYNKPNAVVYSATIR